MATLSDSGLLRELEAIADRYPSMQLCSAPGEPPCFDGTLEIDGAQHRVRLSLPPGYPRVPPAVHELELESGQPLAADGRPRRLGAPGVCLFPHGNDPQAWRPEEGLAADALDRFRELIVHERDEARVFLAEQELAITSELAERLLTGGPGRLVCRTTLPRTQLFAAGVRFDRDLAACYPAPGWSVEWDHHLPVRVEIPWLVLDTDAPWAEITSSPTRLDEVLREQLQPALYELRREMPAWLLIRQSSVGCDERTDMCCVRYRPRDSGSLLALEIIRSTARELLFQRVDGALSGREQLANETIIMVGLGSLGSVTALALARAGIERFVLIDPEKLKLENVCRHVGSIRDVGRHKVEVVREAIRAVNPDARVVPLARWLAWDLPFMSAALELEGLLASDAPMTVVSTCANGPTERELNALAVTHKAPAIYAAALGAAEHGRVFRVLPGQSPCLECILIAQDADPDRHPRYIASGLASESPPPYLQPGLPGLGIDLGQIALLIARFTLQTMAKVRQLDLGIAPEVGDHLLWTNRGGWCFDRPLQLTVEDFPRAPSCPVCGSNSEPSILTAQEREHLEHLLEQLGATME